MNGMEVSPIAAAGVSASEGQRRPATGAAGQSLYASLRSLYRLWQNPEQRRAPFPLAHKLASWRLGFHADSAAIYDLSRNDPRDYVNEYMRKYRCSRINPCNEFFTHKLMWRSFMLNLGFPQAETVSVVAEGSVLMYPFDAERRRYVSPAEFEHALLEDGGRFVVKPEGGERGQGIFLVESENGTLVRRRGHDTQPFRLSPAGKPRIVERMLVPHEFWRALFPHSANTIRALTLWIPGEDAPFLARAVQRVGTLETMPTDNFSGGGLGAPIDLDTGRLGRALRHPGDGGRPPERFTHHPESGAQIEGAVLPHWERVRDTVLRAAASLPTNRYIGWDVFVDAAGTPVIVEANGNTGLQMVQIERGLLTDSRIRRFYQEVGVL